MAKDLHLAVEEAAARGLALPLTRQAEACFSAAVAAGRGEQDAAAVVEIDAGTAPPLAAAAQPDDR
jgi:3-hydroxyisobutyrate dehydrogenase